MDPSRGSPAVPYARLPRASGDGPEVGGRHDVCPPAAPRERGWTLVITLAFFGQDGCPARAGMDPSRHPRPHPSSRLPRASGDGPRQWARSANLTRAAPRERGWTQPSDTHARHDQGCPARAGMDPGRVLRVGSTVRLPRASGDGPQSSFVASLPLLAAPRERGWTRCWCLESDIETGCPARAGMDPRR